MHNRIFLLAAFLTVPMLADDESSFDEPPPGTWQRYDPRAAAGLSPAVFDFSSGQCRIASAPPATIEEYNIFGLARAGLFAPGEFAGTAASADVTAWNPTTNRESVDGTFIGVFTRVQSPVAPGQVTGYSASIIDMGPNSGPNGQGRNGRLQLMLVYLESTFVPLTGYVDFPLDPARDYRLVLVSNGPLHTARVFDLANPAAPVAQLVGTDANFTTGRSGVMILTDRPAVVDATFDNFLTWNGAPPPLSIQPGATPGTIELTCNMHRSMASDLQSTTDLTGIPIPWLPATPQAASKSGNNLVTIFPINGPRRFFRRKGL
jgi:hypothetical protein